MQKIEQSIDNLNQLNSNNVKLHIIPSKKKIGYSTITLINQSKKPINGHISYNNSTPLTLYPNTLFLNIENIFKIQDQTHINLTQYINSTTQQYAIQAIQTIPIKSFQISHSYSSLNYMSLLKGNHRYYHTFTKNKIYKLKLKKTLFKNHIINITASTSLSRKDNQRLIEDAISYSGTYELSIHQNELSTQIKTKWGTLTQQISHKKGLTTFSQFQNQIGYDQSTPKAKFSNTQLHTNYQKSFKIKNIYINTSSSSTLFYSNQKLLGSEQFSIGDQYTIKGFDGNIQGDKGAMSTAQITIPIKNIALTNSLDIGITKEENKYNKLASINTQLNIKINKLSLSINYAKAIQRFSSITQSKKINFQSTYHF